MGTQRLQSQEKLNGWLCLVTDWCGSYKKEYILIRHVTGSCVLWNTGSWDVIATCIGTGWEKGPVGRPYRAGLWPSGFLAFNLMFIVLALGKFLVTAFQPADHRPVLSDYLKKKWFSHFWKVLLCDFLPSLWGKMMWGPRKMERRKIVPGGQLKARLPSLTLCQPWGEPQGHTPADGSCQKPFADWHRDSISFFSESIQLVCFSFCLSLELSPWQKPPLWSRCGNHVWLADFQALVEEAKLLRCRETGWRECWRWLAVSAVSTGEKQGAKTSSHSHTVVTIL